MPLSSERGSYLEQGQRIRGRGGQSMEAVSSFWKIIRLNKSIECAFRAVLDHGDPSLHPRYIRVWCSSQGYIAVSTEVSFGGKWQGEGKAVDSLTGCHPLILGIRDLE